MQSNAPSAALSICSCCGRNEEYKGEQAFMLQYVSCEDFYAMLFLTFSTGFVGLHQANEFENQQSNINDK